MEKKKAEETQYGNEDDIANNGCAILSELHQTDGGSGRKRTQRNSMEKGVKHTCVLYSPFVPYLSPPPSSPAVPLTFLAHPSPSLLPCLPLSLSPLYLASFLSLSSRERNRYMS